MAIIINKASAQVLEVPDEWAKKLVRHQPGRFAYGKEVVERPAHKAKVESVNLPVEEVQPDEELATEDVTTNDESEKVADPVEEKQKTTRKPRSRSKKAN